MSAHEHPELEVGTAGASARREHQRRHANREQRVRDKHPRIRGALLALSDAPTHETVWARGAGGEERVAALRCSPSVWTRASRCCTTGASHAVARTSTTSRSRPAVWVIDTKRYKGKVTIAKPLFGKAKLLTAGRDKTTLADGLAKQTKLAHAAIADIAPDVPVHGA